MTNVLGTIYATKAAITAMRSSGKPGKIVLMDGAGSNGMPTAGYLVYGFSKAGVPQLLGSLVRELKGTSIMPIAVSPGIYSFLFYFV